MQERVRHAATERAVRSAGEVEGASTTLGHHHGPAPEVGHAGMGRVGHVGGRAIGVDEELVGAVQLRERRCARERGAGSGVQLRVPEVVVEVPMPVRLKDGIVPGPAGPEWAASQKRSDAAEPRAGTRSEMPAGPMCAPGCAAAGPTACR